MRNLALLIEYAGTDFNGWQRQPDARTVAGTLEERLAPLVGHRVKLIGAGRTDSGVHALGQVANFSTSSSRSTHELLRALNATLPTDIAVRDLSEVPADFHARFGATSRRYRYCVSTRRRAVGSAYCWEVLSPLVLDSMQAASQAVLGRRDFGSFCASSGAQKSLICTITDCSWIPRPGRLLFEIEADRFLHRMVRSLVGTLVQVGRGRISVEGFSALVQRPARAKAGATAPASGLALLAVRYPTPSPFGGKEGEEDEAVP